MLRPPVHVPPPVWGDALAGGVEGESEVGGADTESDGDGEASPVLGATAGVDVGSSVGPCGGDADSDGCAPAAALVEIGRAHV